MFALIQNGEVAKYPYSASQLRAENPNTSFPRNMTSESLAAWGVFTVAAVERPQVDHTKNVAEGDPALIDGNWTQVWLVSDATAEEIEQRVSDQWAEVRSERNSRLADCDWTQLPDCPLSNTEQLEWASYRQALRDITSQNDPFNVVWPNQPGA